MNSKSVNVQGWSDGLLMVMRLSLINLVVCCGVGMGRDKNGVSMYRNRWIKKI